MPNTIIEHKQYPVNASDYEILEDIGQGVSATVYRAICKPFNETVAIKSLDLEKCNSSLDDIRKEAQMMSLINHPNVVRAHCSFVKDQYLWVVMPYMSGGSCLHIMKSHHPDGFDELVIASVLKDTLKALDYLHHHGHIHRDVKAGNILIEQSGNVKLADFGVSACMFDTGDRQRSRNTFCGTPCWMAPEVMEQLHGYDFKADIWSFGITALELAHGHAPFSKYPPMKILLMTLQNAPPGLDYERDRRFSKAMKEMIAMCLVKDPAKRPTAEKLLKHSFFKQARGPEYISNAILKGLPPLGERVKIVKDKDEARLAAKKVPLTDQELMSQNEYKRGVSDWNFNVDDIKQQPSLLPESGTPHSYPASIKEEDEKSLQVAALKELDADLLDSAAVPLPTVSASEGSSASGTAVSKEKDKPAVAAEGDKMLSEGSVRKAPVSTASAPAANQKPTAGQKPAEARPASAPPQKKETKHIGRFEVIEGDQDDEDEEEDVKDRKSTAEKREPDKRDHADKEKDKDREREKDRSRVGSSSSMERGSQSSRSSSRLAEEEGRERERERGDRERTRGGGREDREREHRKGSSGEDNHRPRERDRQGGASGGSLTNGATPARSAQQPMPKEAMEDKQEKHKGGGSEKGHEKVHRKGRFSVVTQPEGSEGGERGKTEVPLPKKILLPTEKVHSQPATPGSQGSSHASSSLLLPHLQTLMKHTAEQQDAVLQIISILMPSEGKGMLFRSSSEDGGDPKSERERELLQQLLDLQAKVYSLEGDMQNLKVRNSQLERQLNVYFNKEEEERIRQEEAAKDDN